MNSLTRTLALLATLYGAAPAFADSVVATEQVRAELVAEQPTVAPGQSLWVGLTFTIKQGWHTYWSTPGDSGLPPEIKWTLPEGVTAGPLQFPPPEREAFGEFMNFGYTNKVTMLTELKVAPNAAPGPVTLLGDASWLVCADVCIPQDGSLTLPITIGAGASGMSTPASAAITAARESLPKPTPFPVTLTRSGTTLMLKAGPGVPANIANAAFFPNGEGVLNNFAPQTQNLDNGTLTLRMTAGKAATSPVDGVLVVDNAGTRVGYTVNTPVTTGPIESKPFALVPLLVAVGFAFLGGIVLNVMPCVLPVLVMKAMSFISRGSIDSAALRRDGLAYTAGVMVTFGGLVGILLALRAAGDAAGWGFQLQSPIFVAVLGYVMLILALNLSGVFNVGGNFGMGQELASKGGTTGAFFTGLLAVVVATPCTAPFMGTAIGFALTQSPLEAILIFEGLALGLAAPYLLITFAPGAARMLPRPGVWMDRVKQILAFPLYGAAAWMLWILVQQVDATALAGAMTGFVLVGFIAWLFGASQKADTGRGRAWSLGTAAVALAATVALTASLKSMPAAGTETVAASEPYTAAKLEALRAEGKPVFVNFTAAWCITCKVNERIALGKSEVEEAFKTAGVVYLKGDWTNRNAEISAALQAVGRDGVPLYLYYAPKAAEPVILPQVLTPASVIATIAK